MESDTEYQELQLEIGRFDGDLDKIIETAGHVSHNEHQFINWERRAIILESALRYIRKDKEEAAVVFEVKESRRLKLKVVNLERANAALVDELERIEEEGRGLQSE